MDNGSTAFVQYLFAFAFYSPKSPLIHNKLIAVYYSENLYYVNYRRYGARLNYSGRRTVATASAPVTTSQVQVN